ncbi:MAG: hypothetical protein K6A23_01460 [Butyrivibrio sp.]|nr:hypothetical protein [Butyrivibrio sp.]
MIFGSKNSKRFVLGYDLGDDVSQISFLASDSDMPETLSILAGAELYNIPTVLCKRYDVNQWFYGKEAKKHIADKDGIEVKNLVSLARKGDMITVDNTEYDPVLLLTLFIKRTLSLLSMEMSMDLVDAIMVTTRCLDNRMVAVLNRVMEGLDLKNIKVFYQSHEESFYYYMLYQSPDLSVHDVLACDYGYGDLTVYRFTLNHNTKPIVATITSKIYEEISLPDKCIPNDSRRGETLSGLDENFLKIMEDCCENRIITSVFLLGDGYKDNWMKKSLEYLCRTRRVFQGNNMFSKGASIAARERINPTEAGAKYVYLGEDKLKANLGISLQKHGNEVYHALLDAGVNWYEATGQIETILTEGNKLDILMTPLTGGEVHNVAIVLDGLEKRPERTTRIRLNIDMTGASRVRLRVEDLGFGELFPGSGKSWTQEFNI